MVAILHSTAVLLALVVCATCYTKEGWEAAERQLTANMNHSVDPCDDFFEYACGNWKLNHTEEQSDYVTMIAIKVAEDMAIAFENMDVGTSMTLKPIKLFLAFRQAKRYFMMCTESPPINPDLEYALLNKALKQLGGWPVIEFDGDWTSPQGGASALAGTIFGQLGIDTMITGTVTPDIVQPSVNRLAFGAHNLQIGQYMNGTYYIEAPDRDEYAQKILFAALDLIIGDAKPKEHNIRDDAHEIADIEIELWNAAWDAMNHTVPEDQLAVLPHMYNPFTTSQAIRRWPNINWPMMLIKIAENNTDLMHVFGYPFIVAYPAYMDRVDKLLARTSPRTMQNYVLWKLVETLSTLIPSLKHIHKESDEGKRLPFDISPAARCAMQVPNRMPMVSSRIYADMAALNQQDIDSLGTMIGVVLEAWHGMIGEVTWMSDASRMNAFAKIEAIARKVAWPTWIFNDEELDKYYEHLDFKTDDDNFVVVIKNARFKVWKLMSSIGKKTDRYEWRGSGAVVNAWYQPMMNSITITAAIVNSPMYDRRFPQYYNYAHIGVVMGHELGHGFDTSGVFWGPNGGVFPHTWMDQHSLDGFTKMAECVEKEYSEFCYPSIPGNPCINGTQTITENIADNGGVRAAHRAWMAIDKLMGGEPALPGMLSKFTNEQNFYLSYANNWCSYQSDQEIEFLLDVDVHSPDKYRVIGVLHNLPRFAKAFNCKAGDPMVPATQCPVWVKDNMSE